MNTNKQAVETALRTLLVLYTEEHAINSKREIDNDYLIENLSAIAYSNEFVTSYNTKKLLSELREHHQLIINFSNPDRILDVMNFLAVKDDFIALIKEYLATKNKEEAKDLLLKLIKDFSNIEDAKQIGSVSKDFISSGIFNMLVGYILGKELKKQLTLEDFTQMEEVKEDKVSPKLLVNLNSVLEYFNSLDIEQLGNKNIIYQNFDKSRSVRKLSIRNRYKVRKNSSKN